MYEAGSRHLDTLDNSVSEECSCVVIDILVMKYSNRHGLNPLASSAINREPCIVRRYIINKTGERINKMAELINGLPTLAVRASLVVRADLAVIVV